MRAIVLSEPGPATNMSIGEVDVPVPKENEVLLKITHTALNRADISQVRNTLSL